MKANVISINPFRVPAQEKDLAISPYPKQYETTVTTKGGLKIFI